VSFDNHKSKVLEPIIDNRLSVLEKLFIQKEKKVNKMKKKKDSF